jgi:hypothetical protein
VSAAFTRRDLLTRHWRITQNAGDSTITTDPTPSSETAGGVNHQEELSCQSNTAPNVFSAARASGHLVAQVHTSQLDLHAPAAAF